MEKFYSVGVNDLCSVSRMDVVKRGFLFLQGWGGGGGSEGYLRLSGERGHRQIFAKFTSWILGI